MEKNIQNKEDQCIKRIQLECNTQMQIYTINVQMQIYADTHYMVQKAQIKYNKYT